MSSSELRSSSRMSPVRIPANTSQTPVLLNTSYGSYKCMALHYMMFGVCGSLCERAREGEEEGEEGGKRPGRTSGRATSTACGWPWSTMLTRRVQEETPQRARICHANVCVACVCEPRAHARDREAHRE